MRAVARSRVLAGEHRRLQVSADAPPSWSSRFNKIIWESAAGSAQRNVMLCRQAQAPSLLENGNTDRRVQNAYTGAFLCNPKKTAFYCLSPHGSQLEDTNSRGMIHMASSMHRCQGIGMGPFQVLTDRSSKPIKDHSVRSPYTTRSSVRLTEMCSNSHIQPLALFVRAFSISSETQLDEDIGDMHTSVSGHQQSSPAGGQQSSLDVPESKPVSAPSWPNPDNAASYVLMSNIYADGDRWDEVKRINEMRLKARAWKKPGKAYIEVKAKVHEFIVGDRTHQDSTNIYEKLRKIKRHMGHIGYVPYVDLVLENRSYHDPYKSR